MTERFQKVIEQILAHEGGFNDIKEDFGGPTNFGISLNFLKLFKKDLNKDGVIDSKDIRSLKKDDAIFIYWTNFWKPLYDILPEKVGMKMFDVAVNAGDKRSNIILQKAVNALGGKLTEDGLIGKVTIDSANKIDAEKLLNEYCNQQANFYKAIVAKNPSQKKFLNGWLNRASWKPKV